MASNVPWAHQSRFEREEDGKDALSSMSNGDIEMRLVQHSSMNLLAADLKFWLGGVDESRDNLPVDIESRYETATIFRRSALAKPSRNTAGGWTCISRSTTIYPKCKYMIRTVTCSIQTTASSSRHYPSPIRPVSPRFCPFSPITI